MKIYTRTGDQGLTSLFSGERVEKDVLRVRAYGTLDELNSVLGMARAFCRNPRTLSVLVDLQGQLFGAGADLATREGSPRPVDRIREEDWKALESTIDALSSELAPIRHFVLPGGTAGSSILQFGRSVCRRAERLTFRLGKREKDVNPELLIFLNRLSDLLFVLARYENLQEGGREVRWKGKRP